jgi:catechol 2,3-dioxygenase-like lactoylglutathione lyase family enzyme
MFDQLHTVLPASDLNRARAFFHDKLGLDPVEELGPTLIYMPNPSTGIEVYETQFAGTAQNTQVGWRTDDIDAEVARLRSRGVVFEDYDFPDLKTVNGIATLGDAMKSAWFHDSEGNTYCVSQRL